MRKTCAVIDVGSHTVILTVVEQNLDRFTTLYEEVRYPKLGGGLSKEGALALESVNRTADEIISLYEIAKTYNPDTIIIAGTAALRNARNPELLLDRLTGQGLSCVILTGADEAKYSYLSAALDPTYKHCGALAVADIGGVSVEVVLGAGSSILNALSFDAGAVFLTERFMETDPPAIDEIAQVQTFLSELLYTFAYTEPPDLLVGVGGTFVNLASMHLSLAQFNRDKIHGFSLTLYDIQKIRARVCSVTIEERKQMVGLDSPRAPYMPAGILIAEAVLRHFNINRLCVSTYGWRYGLAWEFFAKF